MRTSVNLGSMGNFLCTLCSVVRTPRRKRWTLQVAIALAITLGIAFVFPVSRAILVGYLTNEPFYRHRPASYWRAVAREQTRLQTKNISLWKIKNSASLNRRGLPPLDLLERYLSLGSSEEFPLLAGDPTAVPVLLELLRY